LYFMASRSYPSREKTARFLTADVEQLIHDGVMEKERLSVELRQKLKQTTDAETTIRKSSQVQISLILTTCLVVLIVAPPCR